MRHVGSRRLTLTHYLLRPNRKGSWQQIPAYTHEDTFQFLQEPPCLYRNLTQFQSGLLLIHSDNKLTNDYIVTPWVKCALIEECMKTKNQIGPTLLNCQSSVIYHSCHRYDQAVLSLLIYRLFPETHLDHWIADKYVQFDRLKSQHRHRE